MPELSVIRKRFRESKSELPSFQSMGITRDREGPILILNFNQNPSEKELRLVNELANGMRIEAQLVNSMYLSR